MKNSAAQMLGLELGLFIYFILWKREYDFL